MRDRGANRGASVASAVWRRTHDLLMTRNGNLYLLHLLCFLAILTVVLSFLSAVSWDPQTINLKTVLSCSPYCSVFISLCSVFGCANHQPEDRAFLQSLL